VTSRTPPNDDLAEQALIGHILDIGGIPAGVNGLVPSDFHQPTNETIWAAVRSLTDQQKPCDLVSVRDYLQQHGKLDTQGGVPSQSLTALIGTPPIADPAYTAEIIQKHSQRRQAIKSYQRGLQQAQDPTSDLDELLRRTEQDLGRIQGNGQKAERSSWSPVDLAPVLDGTWQPPHPTVGKRSDGKGVLYPGKTHTGIGETEAGKGWFALSGAVDEMADGNHVVYVDFEDDEAGVVGRLLTMGISPRMIDEHFEYIHPEHPLKGRHLEAFLALLHDRQPTLVLLDGVTEAMVLHGLDPLDNVDISTFNTSVVTQLTATGAAELSLDHVVKNGENRGKYALGGVHKLNIVSGASYILENRHPFGIGIKGVSSVKIAKDRPAQLRVNALPSRNNLYWFGDLVLDSHGEGYADVCVFPPIQHQESSADERDDEPTEHMERVAKHLAEQGHVDSKELIETGVKGRATEIRKALNLLIVRGFVSKKRPYELLKPYPPEDQKA
jgi:DnaB-like helicase N terminal domain